MPDKQQKSDKTTGENHATQPGAEAATAPKAVLAFNGEKDGRFIRGLPRRDLTAADLANLTPGQFRDATAPGPTGKPLYTVADEAAVAERFGGNKE